MKKLGDRVTVDGGVPLQVPQDWYPPVSAVPVPMLPPAVGGPDGGVPIGQNGLPLMIPEVPPGGPLLSPPRDPTPGPVVQPRDPLPVGLRPPMEGDPFAGLANAQTPRSNAPEVIPGETPPVTPPSPEAGGSASLGVSVGAGGQMPKLPGDPKALQVDTAARMKAEQDLADAEIRNTNYVATAKNFEAQEIAQHDAIQSKADDAYKTAVDNAQKSYGLVASKLDALNPTIDPGRLYRNKQAGQKIAGGIAAFLFGISGKGIEYLQQCLAEQEADVKAQQMEYENASSKMKAQLAAAGNVYAMHRENRLDAATAFAASRKNLVDVLGRQVDAVKSSGASAEIQARTDVTKSVIAQEGQKIQADFNNKAHQQGTSDREIALRAGALQQQIAHDSRMEILTAMKDAKGKDDKAPPSQIQVKVADAEATLKLLKEAKDAHSKGTGITSAVRDSILKLQAKTPVVGEAAKAMSIKLGMNPWATDTKLFNAQRMGLKQLQHGEALSLQQESDLKENSAKTGIGGIDPGQLDNMIEAAQNSVEILRAQQAKLGQKDPTTSAPPASDISSFKPE